MSRRQYFPVFLDLVGKPVALVGGGEVALRKLLGLLAAGARVTVISPTLTSEMQALLAEKKFEHIGRRYRKGDLTGYFLAFVATDDGALNAAVARDGIEIGVLVNASDDPANCDFIIPSVINRGDLTVAISTGGASPAAARLIREELEEFLTEEHALLLEVAAEVRGELRERDVVVDAEIWNRALQGDVRVLLAAGRREEAKRKLLQALLGAADGGSDADAAGPLLEAGPEPFVVCGR